jgi:hypothetical protein
MGTTPVGARFVFAVSTAPLVGTSLMLTLTHSFMSMADFLSMAVTAGRAK